MTFGRKPSDVTDASPFGPGPRPDTPYGRTADGFGGYARPPDGFGPSHVAPTTTSRPPIQRKEVSAEQLGTAASTALQLDDEVKELLTATTQIERGKTEAQNLLIAIRGDLRPEVAAGKLGIIVGNVQGWIAAVAGMQQRHAIAATDPARFNALGRAEPEAQYRSVEHAFAVNLPRILDALNNIDRVAIELGATARTPQPDPLGLVQLRTALTSLHSAAAALGWTPPAGLQEVNERRFAFEACPEGAREDRPDTCTLSDTERLALRTKVWQASSDAVDHFIAACEPAEKLLLQIIADETAQQEFLASSFADAISAGLKVAFPGGGVAIAWLGDVVKTTRRSFLRPKATGEAVETAGALNALRAAIKQSMQDVQGRLLGLDDDSLRYLVRYLEQLTLAQFKPRVDSFVARYRAQVAPIGHPLESPVPTFQPVRPWQEAAWITAPGGLRRLALVGHRDRSEYVPFGGHVERHDYEFVRWIDDDLQAAAGADSAPPVEASDVANLPIVEIMGGHRAP